MKRKDGAYVLIKRYKKETFKEHKKGNGTADYYEPEYDSKNPTEFVQRVTNFKNSMPLLKDQGLPSFPESPINENEAVPVGGQISTSDVAPFYAYAGLLKRNTKAS